MILGLIPCRLNSTRLKKKPLLMIDGLPMIIHTLKRAMLSKELDKVVVCTDSRIIKKIVEDHGGEATLTSSKHKNGTERIAEVAAKYKCKLVIDIQGDEPLISYKEIDQVIRFHKKNDKFDIVLPSSKSPKIQDSKHVVKLVKSKSNRVLYFSRYKIPFNFSKKPKYFLKHMSVISFKPKKLKEFAKLSKSDLEFSEGIELLRALENDFNIGTFSIKSNSLAVDIKSDLIRVIDIMHKDPIRKLY